MCNFEENSRSGYVLKYRSIMDKDWICNNSDYYMWWDFFIMWARYEKGKISKGEKFIEIERGQIYKSHNTLARMCKTSKGKMQTFLKLLVEDKMITIVNESKCSRITICNYDTYQKPSTNNQSITNQSSTDDQPIVNQLSTEINNLKEIVSNLIKEKEELFKKKTKRKKEVENPDEFSGDKIPDELILDENKSAYSQFCDGYFYLYVKKLEIGKPEFDKKEGKLMKELINIIKNLKPEFTELDAVKTWYYIINNWDKLPDFERSLITIGQIKSNIARFINFFKNGKSTKYGGKIANDTELDQYYKELGLK